jgi:hypothetical protein
MMGVHSWEQWKRLFYEARRFLSSANFATSHLEGFFFVGMYE